MHSDAPRPAVEDPESPTDDDSDDEDNDPAPPSIDEESNDDDPPPLLVDMTLLTTSQMTANASANSSINYQSSNAGGGSPINVPRELCKNCKSTSHGTQWFRSTKCFKKNCGKIFASADERKIHFIQEYGCRSQRHHRSSPH